MTTAILSREQRDGVYEFAIGHLGSDRLAHLAESKNVNAVKALVSSLPACIRLLDQIGWEEHGEAASYEVALDAEIHRLLSEIEPRIEGTIQDDERSLGNATDSSDEATARRFLRHDRCALDAVKLMQAA